MWIKSKKENRIKTKYLFYFLICIKKKIKMAFVGRFFYSIYVGVRYFFFPLLRVCAGNGGYCSVPSAKRKINFKFTVKHKWKKNKYTKNCISCNIDGQMNRLIFETNHCYVVVRDDDQTWFGRAVIVLKNHKPPADISNIEWIDVLNIRKRMDIIYRRKLGMVYSNIVQAGNLTKCPDYVVRPNMGYHHTHIHYIPRYKDTVLFEGKVFTDPDWGRPLNLNIPKRKPSQEMLQEIVYKLRFYFCMSE